MMKKILLALAIIGITCSGAEAQDKGTAKDACSAGVRKVATKKVARQYHQPLHTAKYVKNYQVCKEEGGYYTCCVHKNTATRSW
jgi:hypothetical protein